MLPERMIHIYTDVFIHVPSPGFIDLYQCLAFTLLNFFHPEYLLFGFRDMLFFLIRLTMRQRARGARFFPVD